MPRDIDRRAARTRKALHQALLALMLRKGYEALSVQDIIDEADVGQLKAGSKVSFTVDAYPADTFHGAVSQMRLAPTTADRLTLEELNRCREMYEAHAHALETFFLMALPRWAPEWWKRDVCAT